MTVSPAFHRQVCDIAAALPGDIGDAFFQIGVVAMAYARMSPRQREQVRLAALGYLGLLQMRRARSTGVMVGVCNRDETGTDGSDEYMTVCEDHGQIVGHATVTLAKFHAPCPEGWCDECREIIARKGVEGGAQ